MYTHIMCVYIYIHMYTHIMCIYIYITEMRVIGTTWQIQGVPSGKKTGSLGVGWW
jgi:hypothetical protein